ncbi:hypothetical protein ACIRNI_31920 [Streptomyces sp. NPDC093546]|uniref:hypothetical protein n=1 Tax=Streptomyces sp. NPDC093546 TaxID=3366040 RepID=UPI0038213DD6
MEILKRLKNRATGATRRAMQELRQTGLAAEGALSKQFLESLDIASPLRRSYAELFSATNAALAKTLADLYPKPDFADLNRSLVEHLRPQVDLTAALRSSFADALPKLDIAGMLPRFDFSVLPAGLDDDGKENEDGEVSGQMSFEDVVDDRHDGEEGGAAPDHGED